MYSQVMLLFLTNVVLLVLLTLLQMVANIHLKNAIVVAQAHRHQLLAVRQMAAVMVIHHHKNSTALDLHLHRQ